MKAGNIIRQIARISSIVSIAAILYLFYDDALKIIIRERQQIVLFLFSQWVLWQECSSPGSGKAWAVF